MRRRIDSKCYLFLYDPIVVYFKDPSWPRFNNHCVTICKPLKRMDFNFLFEFPLLAASYSHTFVDSHRAQSHESTHPGRGDDHSVRGEDRVSPPREFPCDTSIRVDSANVFLDPSAAISEYPVTFAGPTRAFCISAHQGIGHYLMVGLHAS